jgi:membrane peptidoglycan carboxypeptidase
MAVSSRRVRGVLTSILGLAGLSALAGVLISAMVAPAVAIAGVGVNSGVGVFDALPEYIDIGEQAEKNTLWAYRGARPNEGYVKIAEVYWQDREEIPIERISPHVVNAAVAGEDRRFFDHSGVDATSIVRAVLGNVFSGDIQSGASTLTMQLIKNIFVQRSLYLPTEEERQEAYNQATATDFERKLNEMKLAIGLEKRFTKEEILEAYLNIAPFGGNTYGIQAASQKYFGKQSLDLTPSEAASLMAIVQYPTTRNLASSSNFQANQERRDVILQAMFAEGYLTEEEYNEAIAIPVDSNFVNPAEPTNGCLAANEYAKFFCDYVVRNVENFEGLGATPEERNSRWRQGGLDVYTTLNMELQQVAQDRVWELVPNDVETFELGSATVSVEVKTGRILTMAQNKVFNDTEEGGGITATAVNFNTDRPYGGSSGFQVGSTYKIFALLAWLQRGFGLNEVVDASKFELDQAEFLDTCADGGGPWGGIWEFKNSGNLEIPSVTVYEATTRSINSAYASIAKELDQCEIRRNAEALGVHRADNGPLQTNPAAVLGTNEIAPLTMATAFAGIANGGQVCTPVVVDRFVTASGPDLPGQTTSCRQALTPDVAAAAAAPMRGVITGGTGSRSNPGGNVPVIGKTGTTDNQVQTWMVGSSTEVATAVWVGNILGDTSMRRISNGTVLRHDIFRPVMQLANEQYGGDSFPTPPARLQNGAGVQLPDITGLFVDEALLLLNGIGLNLEIRSGGGGVVSFFEPAPGTLLARGQTVYVDTDGDAGDRFVPTTVMPNIISPALSEVAARGAFATAGMYGSTNFYCVEGSAGSETGNGFAIGQSPEPGEIIRVDTEIEIAMNCLAGAASNPDEVLE